MASNMKFISKALGVANAKRDIPSPYLEANPISRFTLWWLNNHVWRGFKRPLSPTDIFTVIPEETSERRASKLDSEWKCLTEEEKNKKNSLLQTVLKNDWKLFAASLFLIFLGEISKFIQPFMIAEIVIFFKGKNGASEEQIWGYAAGMVLLTLFYAVVSTYGQFLGQIVAMRWRTSCTAVMSRKASRLSSKALSELSSGTVINLLATDVEKFYNAASEFQGLFVGPLVLLTLLIHMAVTVQLSILPALFAVVFLTALRMQMGNVSGRLRLKLADWSDKRILLVTEIVSAMRMIKAFCCEKVYGSRAHELRGKEIRNVGWIIFLNSLTMNLGYSCDKLITFFLVITFILTGHAVNYSLALQILTWMKMGQLGFLNFPLGYSMWKQMEASLSRIEKFLLAEEFTGYARIRKESAINTSHQVKITLTNVSASWAFSEKHHTKAQKDMKDMLLKSISTLNAVTTKEKFVASGAFSLRNISFEVTNGMLVGIVGPVGSGKTSLLLVILGNLKIGDGTRRLKGKIAYVPQKPWIRADTVRNNILMGEKMDRTRYSEVLKACALQKDIAAMENGDTTQIGDKGSSLSGGQRARISLARAVYRNADIYILDDPFSSLDSKVGTHIFHECIRGLLKGKLVLMATHYVHLLNYTDHVVVLKEGKMLASGPLDKVKACVNLNELIKDPEHNIYDRSEIHDVFEKEHKKNLLMPLLGNQHIKKEHAHIPDKRATPFKVYLNYWKAGYGYVLMTLFCILLMGQQVLAILGEWWLVYQLSGGAGKKGYKSYPKGYGNSSSYGYDGSKHAYMGNTSQDPYLSNTSYIGNNHTSSFTAYDAPSEHEANYAAAAPAVSIDEQATMLGTYALYIMFSILLGLLSVVAGTFFLLMASRNLYNAMFTKILWAPMKIFSSDKTGEMVNRFARDTGRMDDIIPITINATFLTGAIIITQASYICVINYYVVLATLPFLVGLTLFIMYCVRSIRDTKRLESEFRTPTFEHLQHLLNGLEVIRAFEMETLMIEESDTFLDRHTAAWHLYIGTMYWMKMRLNCMVSVYLMVVLIIALASPHKEAMATPLGLSLSYIIVFMSRVQYFATFSTMLDANMTSVEHVMEYDHLPQEPALHTDQPLPPAWPSQGNIDFDSVNLLYHGSKTHALKNVNFKVQAGEKVGIVGRTGAGKSSLFNVLLRLDSYEGVINIDGVDISKIGLEDLRNKITFILQEPTLSNGTLRFNLDPFQRYKDDDLWEVLDKVNLRKKVSRQPGRLDMEIEADGNNFSGGQKQLLCMARALLSMHKIMLLDEITANVDKDTDMLLHKIINDEFRGCTILHISHRLESLIEYDKILEIGAGSVLEFGQPHMLLQNPDGAFSAMVAQLGTRQAALLGEIANHKNMLQQDQKESERSEAEACTEVPKIEASGAPIVRRLSQHFRERVQKRTTTELRLNKIKVVIENDKHKNGTVVHAVSTRLSQGNSMEDSSVSDTADERLSTVEVQEDNDSMSVPMDQSIGLPAAPAEGPEAEDTDWATSGLDYDKPEDQRQNGRDSPNMEPATSDTSSSELSGSEESYRYTTEDITSTEISSPEPSDKEDASSSHLADTALSDSGQECMETRSSGLSTTNQESRRGVEGVTLAGGEADDSLNTSEIVSLNHVREHVAMNGGSSNGNKGPLENVTVSDSEDYTTDMAFSDITEPSIKVICKKPVKDSPCRTNDGKSVSPVRFQDSNGYDNPSFISSE